jgi:hypothetical protein
MTKKMSISITVLVLLIVGLVTISFGLAYTIIKMENNSFQTGNIAIDLNNGEPVIMADEFLFEPGMTVEKPFYIQNNGTWAVYYKLYFDQVDGDLGDVLDVTILDNGGAALLTGKLSALTRESASPLEDVLETGERQDLKVRFHFPEEAGNAMQSGSLSFELSAITVQTKNNPDKAYN